MFFWRRQYLICSVLEQEHTEQDTNLCVCVSFSRLDLIVYKQVMRAASLPPLRLRALSQPEFMGIVLSSIFTSFLILQYLAICWAVDVLNALASFNTWTTVLRAQDMMQTAVLKIFTKYIANNYRLFCLESFCFCNYSFVIWYIKACVWRLSFHLFHVFRIEFISCGLSEFPSNGKGK